MRRLRLLALLLVLPLAAGCADQLTPAAAMVDGHRIPEATVEQELDFLRDDENYRRGLAEDGDAYRGRERRGILTQLIHLTLVEQELERREETITEAEVDRLIDRVALDAGGRERLDELIADQNLSAERFRELARRQARVEKLQRVLTADIEADPAEVQAAYEAGQAFFRQARLSRITVSDPEEAAGIAARVQTPAAFAAAARESSSDEAAESGGDLGWVDLRTVDESTRGEIEAVPDGGVAGPVQVGDGYRLFLVHERRVAPLSDVSDEIADQLLAQRRQQAIGTFLREGLASARVVVNPKYGRFDPRELSVVAGPDGLAE